MTENEPDRIEITEERTLALDYLVAVPERYDAEGDAVPLILFLHGAGERGDDLDKVKAWGPPRMIEAGEELPAIVISPQCPGGSWWSNELDALVALLDKIEEEYNIDPDRIYVTGLSMGGYGSFALAAKQPERFAAIVPICGGGLYFDALGLSRMPMWVFHGDADRIVPVDESRRMVETANRINGENARLTEYEGVGHNSWSRAYGDDAMWEWLFEQHRED